MTIILLIRHGMTDYVKLGRSAGRTPGIHLNEEGRAQVAALAERIRHLPVKAVYASPLERTMETAQAVAAALTVPVTPRAGLLETDMGEWTGMEYKDIRDSDTWRAIQTHPKGTRIPGGETVDEIQARMVAEIEAIRQAHPGEMVAAVSHADPIKATIAHYLGLDVDRFQSLVIDPASVSILVMGDHGTALALMNHTGDLPKPTAPQDQRKLVKRISWPEEGRTMARVIYDLKSVTRVTASAVGVPGKRTFYIQARDSQGLFSFVCEKEQVALLCEGIEQLLSELDEKVPATKDEEPVPDVDLELEEPLEPLFRIGQLGLGYDQEEDALVLVAYELPESEDTDPESLAVARIWASRGQMRALSRHGTRVVQAGRPICPLCGEPMDASGHICPKKNGHKPLPTE